MSLQALLKFLQGPEGALAVTFALMLFGTFVSLRYILRVGGFGTSRSRAAAKAAKQQGSAAKGAPTEAAAGGRTTAKQAASTASAGAAAAAASSGDGAERESLDEPVPRAGAARRQRRHA